MERHPMPLNRSLLWILVATLLISGSAFMGWQYYLHIRERRYHDDQYKIVAIVQSNPQSEGLKTAYLAELLGLSLDKPENLYHYDVKAAEAKLMRCPLIKKTTIKKILPGTLYIDYQMRIPCAYLGDCANTALDKEGYLFPFRPFFTPKHIPTVYLGIDGVVWGACLMELPSFQLALDVMDKINSLGYGKFLVRTIDVSQAQADSHGSRQIIVALEDLPSGWTPKLMQSQEIFLRLSTDHYFQDLANFRTLEGHWEKEYSEKTGGNKKFIIDLRIPQLAFIKKEG